MLLDQNYSLPSVVFGSLAERRDRVLFVLNHKSINVVGCRERERERGQKYSLKQPASCNSQIASRNLRSLLENKSSVNIVSKKVVCK